MIEGTAALPLKTAYQFGAEKGLEAEVQSIRNMNINWNLPYSSTVRRGYVVALFEQRGIFEEFKAKHWPNGNTPNGLRERASYLRVKERYDEFLEGKIPAPAESEEEIDQQFAAESDLRDFLAKNLTCIEPGLRLYDQSGGTGVEFPVEGGRIDILAIDDKGGLVVIELKLGRGREKALGQLLYYMGWVDKNLGKSPCRGIIIAKEIPEELALAVQRTPGVSLHRYKLAVSVELVAAK